MTYEELVKNHAGDLVEKLVTDVLSKMLLKFDLNLKTTINGR